jgi:hypothetical protein
MISAQTSATESFFIASSLNWHTAIARTNGTAAVNAASSLRQREPFGG